MAYVIIMCIGIALGIVFKNKNKKKGENLFLPIMIAFITCLIVAIVSASSLPSTLKLEKTTPIISLDDSNKIKGSSFLGTGASSTGMTYTFLEKTEHEGFKMKSVSTEDIEIRYGKNARIETYKETFKYKWMEKAFIFKADVKSYVIYVPKNSIKTNYSVDLKQ